MVKNEQLYKLFKGEFGESLEQKEEIIKILLQLVPANYLIKEGIPAIVRDDQIIMRPVFGLNIFLASWLSEQDDNPFLISEISKFIENFNDYLEYSKKILNFIYDKGRVPEKDEAWDLDIPIDEMDLVLDLINVKITGDVYTHMSLDEKKYYDDLSKVLILSKKKLGEFKLENLTKKFDYNLIDAKLTPKFINDLLNVGNLNEEIAKYLKISELSKTHLNRLNKLATKIIKLNLSEKKKLSLLDLARRLNVSIMESGEAIYFLNNSEKLIKEEFSKEEIEKLSNKLAEALRYCNNKKEELNVNLLISRFNSDLLILLFNNVLLL